MLVACRLAGLSALVSDHAVGGAGAQSGVGFQPFQKPAGGSGALKAPIPPLEGGAPFKGRLKGMAGPFGPSQQPIVYSSLVYDDMLNTAWIDWPVDTRGLHFPLPRPP
jgi:hypothetical protein